MNDFFFNFDEINVKVVTLLRLHLKNNSYHSFNSYHRTWKKLTLLKTIFFYVLTHLVFKKNYI